MRPVGTLLLDWRYQVEPYGAHKGWKMVCIRQMGIHMSGSDRWSGLLGSNGCNRFRYFFLYLILPLLNLPVGSRHRNLGGPRHATMVHVGFL